MRLLGLTGEVITLLRLANALVQNGENWKAAIESIMRTGKGETIDKIEKYFKQNSTISKAQTILDNVNALPRIYEDFTIGYTEILREVLALIETANNGGQE